MAVREGSRNTELSGRFLAGEHLTTQQVQEEYGGSRSALQWAIRTMKAQGYVFKSKKVSGNAQEYWLDLRKSRNENAHTEEQESGKQSSQIPSPGKQSSQIPSHQVDDRPVVAKLRERLTAGEGLVASEIAEEYGVSANTLSVTLAQMTKEGYEFAHDSDRKVITNGKARTLKRHRVTGKHESMPQGTRTQSPGTNGRRKKSPAGFRMPAPQVDAPTEVILVHRIDDGIVQVGMMQGSHQWLLEVRNYVE